MGHKNDYSAVVFIQDQSKPKKWNYIHKLSTFRRFLDNKHQDWQYMNVYNRRTKAFLKRLYKEEITPDFIEH
jgi:hypothetical protein